MNIPRGQTIHLHTNWRMLWWATDWTENAEDRRSVRDRLLTHDTCMMLTTTRPDPDYIDYQTRLFRRQKLVIVSPMLSDIAWQLVGAWLVGNKPFRMTTKTDPVPMMLVKPIRMDLTIRAYWSPEPIGWDPAFTATGDTLCSRVIDRHEWLAPDMLGPEQYAQLLTRSTIQSWALQPLLSQWKPLVEAKRHLVEDYGLHPDYVWLHGRPFPEFPE